MDPGEHGARRWAALVLAAAVAVAGGLAALDLLRGYGAAWVVVEAVAPDAEAAAAWRAAGATAVLVRERTLAELAGAGRLRWAWGWERREADLLAGRPPDPRSRPGALYLQVEDEELRRWLLLALRARWGAAGVAEVRFGDQPWIQVTGLPDPPLVPADARPLPEPLWRLPLGIPPSDLDRVAALGLIPVPAWRASSLAVAPTPGELALLGRLAPGTPVAVEPDGGPPPGRAALAAWARALADRRLGLAVLPGPGAAALAPLVAALPGATRKAARWAGGGPPAAGRGVRLWVVQAGRPGIAGVGPATDAATASRGPATPLLPPPLAAVAGAGAGAAAVGWATAAADPGPAAPRCRRAMRAAAWVAVAGGALAAWASPDRPAVRLLQEGYALAALAAGVAWAVRWLAGPEPGGAAGAEAGPVAAAGGGPAAAAADGRAPAAGGGSAAAGLPVPAGAPVAAAPEEPRGDAPPARRRRWLARWAAATVSLGAGAVLARGVLAHPVYWAELCAPGLGGAAAAALWTGLRPAAPGEGGARLAAAAPLLAVVAAASRAAAWAWPPPAAVAVLAGAALWGAAAAGERGPRGQWVTGLGGAASAAWLVQPGVAAVHALAEVAIAWAAGALWALARAGRRGAPGAGPGETLPAGERVPRG